MEYNNALEPTKEQIGALMAPGESDPIYMLNLVKYKERADYADGRDSGLSGREAYALYAEGVVKTLAAVGGGVVFSANVSALLIGEVEELWDDVAIAMYPSRAAMVEMFSSAEYQAIHVHREAGLEGQLNIETRSHFAPGVLAGGE